ncbi:hypothetical protein IWQ61_006374 [Dispira simplex]|nr:hypothetical protein IWQ61_006374 [Dispira simplex]
MNKIPSDDYSPASWSQSTNPDKDYLPVDIHPQEPEKASVHTPSANQGLHWENLHYEVPTKTTGLRQRVVEFKTLLDGVSGHVAPGEIVAIMGSSGAGKSTLLNSLAGRVKTGKLSGTILFNNQKRDPPQFKKQAAYVEQDDLLYPQLTVRETIQYAATLKLPSKTHSAENKRKRVEDVIASLRLVNAANTYIGDAMIRGVSGGERKRASIGTELVTNPQFMFLDEATSGLDSNSAMHVCEVVRDICRQRQIGILMTIHQPSAKLLDLFDKIILLCKGQTVYYGPTQEALPYFASIGYHCGQHENPADFYLDLMSIDQSSPERMQEGDVRVRQLITHFQTFAQNNPDIYTAPTLPRPHLPIGTSSANDVFNSATNLDSEGGTDLPTEKETLNPHLAQEALTDRLHPGLDTSGTTWALPWAKEFYVLIKRCWTASIRSRFLIFADAGRSLIMMLLMGFVFFQLDHNQTSIQNRIGLLFFLPIDIIFSVVMPMQSIFALEMAIMTRERSGGTYRISSFYLAKFITALPFPLLFTALYSTGVYFLANLQYEVDKFFIFFALILLFVVVATSFGMAAGALFPNIQMSQIMAPLLIVIFLIFGGNLVNVDGMTPVLSWIRYISPINYIYNALAKNEMTGLVFTCDGGDQSGCLANGEDVLRRFSIDSFSIGASVAYLVALIAAYHVITYASLRWKAKPRFIWI